MSNFSTTLILDTAYATSSQPITYLQNNVGRVDGAIMFTWDVDWNNIFRHYPGFSAAKFVVEHDFEASSYSVQPQNPALPAYNRILQTPWYANHLLFCDLFMGSNALVTNGRITCPLTSSAFSFTTCYETQLVNYGNAQAFYCRRRAPPRTFVCDIPENRNQISIAYVPDTNGPLVNHGSVPVMTFLPGATLEPESRMTVNGTHTFKFTVLKPPYLT